MHEFTCCDLKHISVNNCPKTRAVFHKIVTNSFTARLLVCVMTVYPGVLDRLSAIAIIAAAHSLDFLAY